MRRERYLLEEQLASSIEPAGSGFARSPLLDLPSAVHLPSVNDDKLFLIGARQGATGPAPVGESIIRLVDFASAFLLLIIFLPVIIMISAAIFFVDRGPVFFVHRRIGQGGAPFDCFKFRSMCVGAEDRLAALLAHDPALLQQWQCNQKLSNDPRVTAIGRLLRVTSLDELPQLFNVLRGEMSFVGPRPIIASEIPRFGRFIASYYSVKPGLTGLWQVSGRSDTTYRRRVATDVLYARNRSLGFNARIMVATIPAVLLARGSA